MGIGSTGRAYLIDAAGVPGACMHLLLHLWHVWNEMAKIHGFGTWLLLLSLLREGLVASRHRHPWHASLLLLLLLLSILSRTSCRYE